MKLFICRQKWNGVTQSDNTSNLLAFAFVTTNFHPPDKVIDRFICNILLIWNYYRKHPHFSFSTIINPVFWRGRRKSCRNKIKNGMSFVEFTNDYRYFLFSRTVINLGRLKLHEFMRSITVIWAVSKLQGSAVLLASFEKNYCYCVLLGTEILDYKNNKTQLACTLVTTDRIIMNIKITQFCRHFPIISHDFRFCFSGFLTELIVYYVACKCFLLLPTHLCWWQGNERKNADRQMRM